MHVALHPRNLEGLALLFAGFAGCASVTDYYKEEDFKGPPEDVSGIWINPSTNAVVVVKQTGGSAQVTFDDRTPFGGEVKGRILLGETDKGKFALTVRPDGWVARFG